MDSAPARREEFVSDARLNPGPAEVVAAATTTSDTTLGKRSHALFVSLGLLCTLSLGQALCFSLTDRLIILRVVENRMRSMQNINYHIPSESRHGITWRRTLSLDTQCQDQAWLS